MTVISITFLRVIPTTTFQNSHVDITLVVDLSGEGCSILCHVILISSSSLPPPPLPPPPRRLLHCDHLRRVICKMFNGTFRMSQLFCRLPLGARCCDAAQSRIVSTTIFLEMGNACFLRISCRSIPTNTVSKLSAKSLGGNSLMARKVGACSMMVVTPSSPHAERDRSHGGREKHLCENYPAQRQHQSAKMGRPLAFFAQIDEGACSLPVHTPSVRRRRRKHLGFVTCWQLNNWTRLEDLFKWHLWPSCNIQIRVWKQTTLSILISAP